MTKKVEEEPGWKWWGPCALEEGAAVELQIGPSRVRLNRRTRSWRVAHLQGTDLYSAGLARGEIASELLDEKGSADWYQLLAFDPAPDALWLQPRLADRPVVMRPVQPILLPPSEVVQVFVSTPLWLALESPQRRRPVGEFPFWRLSDTWFGTPLAGELCYAAKTLARRSVAEVVLGPHRAVTRLELRNETARPVCIDRFSLPVPRLSLAVDAQGVLVTEDVVATHRGEDQHAEVELQGRGGRRAKAELIAPAREQGETRFAARIVHSILNVRM